MPTDLPTDRRLIAALVVLADEHDLPRKNYLRKLLLGRAEGAEVAEFIDRYTKQAWKDLEAQLLEEFHHGDEERVLTSEVTRLWPRHLMRVTLVASGYAYAIRAAAQGPQGPAPDERVWQALVAALTLVVVQHRVHNADARALSQSVTATIKMLGEL